MVYQVRTLTTTVLGMHQNGIACKRNLLPHSNNLLLQSSNLSCLLQHSTFCHHKRSRKGGQGIVGPGVRSKSGDSRPLFTLREDPLLGGHCYSIRWPTMSEMLMWSDVSKRCIHGSRCCSIKLRLMIRGLALTTACLSPPNNAGGYSCKFQDPPFENLWWVGGSIRLLGEFIDCCAASPGF